MIADLGKHCYEPIVSMRERKNAEGVEDSGSIGDDRKQPVKVFLVDALREESDDFEKASGVGSMFPEHWRGE